MLDGTDGWTAHHESPMKVRAFVMLASAHLLCLHWFFVTLGVFQTPS